MRPPLRGLHVAIHILGCAFAVGCAVPGASDPTHVRQLERGEWSPVFDWPTHAWNMAVLPSGKVLSWGANCYGHDFALWDPSDGSSVTFPHPPGLDLGLPGLNHDPDGNLLLAGGVHDCDWMGEASTYRFDHVSESLVRVQDMAYERFLPSLIPLSNGRLYVSGGNDRGGRPVPTPEVWDGNGWSELATSNGEAVFKTYQFLDPDGRVFRGGGESLTDWLDVGRLTWMDVATGDRNQVRGYAGYAPYGPGKILATGGCDDPVDILRCDSGTVHASAEVIDLNDESPAWRTIAGMANPRRQHHATTLPDGTVLITGGTRVGTLFDTFDGALYAPELWDPETETFTELAPMAEFRPKHSAAVLLVDGRVLIAGGEYDRGDERVVLETAEIFSPPYLFRGPRPAVESAPESVFYAEDFFVGTRDGAAIAGVTLVRLGANSVSWNAGQQFNRLSFSAAPGGLTVTAPANGILATPGYHILFILDGRGVPSEGRVIKLASR